VAYSKTFRTKDGEIKVVVFPTTDELVDELIL